MKNTIIYLQKFARLILDLINYVILRRRSLILTIEGWILVAAMMLIGLAALNTAAPLLYLMFAMMCAFFVLSAVLAVNSIRGVDIDREIPHVWVANSPLRGYFHLRNRKGLSSSFSLRVRDVQENGLVIGAGYFDRLPPGREKMTQEFQCRFNRRGLYALDTIELATRFPFGLIERRLFYHRPAELLILPPTIRIDRAMERMRNELGDYEANVKGLGSGLYGLREYSPELPAKDIHWKVSARRGTLMVREYESEEKRRASVILNNVLPNVDDLGDLSERFEMAVILAASVIEWLIQHEHEAELRTASGVVGFGSGLSHITRCRRALASLTLIDAPTHDPHLYNKEPGIVHFPVIFREKAPELPGHFPFSIDEFAAELAAAAGPRQADPQKPLEMFEQSA